MEQGGSAPLHPPVVLGPCLQQWISITGLLCHWCTLLCVPHPHCVCALVCACICIKSPPWGEGGEGGGAHLHGERALGGIQGAIFPEATLSNKALLFP